MTERKQECFHAEDLEALDDLVGGPGTERRGKTEFGGCLTDHRVPPGPPPAIPGERDVLDRLKRSVAAAEERGYEKLVVLSWDDATDAIAEIERLRKNKDTFADAFVHALSEWAKEVKKLAGEATSTDEGGES